MRSKGEKSGGRDEWNLWIRLWSVYTRVKGGGVGAAGGVRRTGGCSSRGEEVKCRTRMTDGEGKWQEE